MVSRNIKIGHIIECTLRSLQIYNLVGCIRQGFSLRLLLCDVVPSEFPKSTQFNHPCALVIRSGTKFGENCKIYQSVTIGDRDAKTKNGRATIGNNVTIYAGAIILGGVTIGDNAIIGAGSIVLDDVPANCVYVCGINPIIKLRGL